MPTYDYRCLACGAVHEARKSVAERASDLCSCGELARQIVSSRVGFALKGDGWARDNYGIKPAVKPSEP